MSGINITFEEKTFSNGQTYVNSSLISYGDYDNSCAVERANVRYLLEKYPDYKRYYMEYWENGRMFQDGEWKDILPESPIVEIYGGYGYTGIWIRKDINEKDELLSSLESYPCFNDEIVSEIENEMENEAWNDWIKKDLIKTLSEELQEKVENIEDDDLYNVYFEAKEATNTYFEVESGGNGYIDIDAIKDKFAELIQAI